MCSLVQDEDIAERCHEYLRSIEKNKCCPKNFQEFVNTNLLQQSELTRTWWAAGEKKSITIKTARAWMRQLGFNRKLNTKGVYYDGHERADVLEYRKVYLEKMNSFKNLMTIYEDGELKKKWK